MKKYIINVSRFAIVFPVALLGVLLCNPIQVHAETEAESDYIFSLLDQGYSWEVAWDEMCEVMRGKSGGFGTGGIDGIDPYSSGKASNNSAPKQPEHVHEWVEAITKEATCKETGIMTFTCSCGETKEDEIPLVDHIYSPSDDSIPATCEKSGSTHFVCNECGDDYWEEVSPVGHSFTKYTEDKSASCTEDGSKSIHCDNYGCDAIKEGSVTVIKALGHKEDTNHEVTPATFWKDGTEKIYCQTCGEIISETVLSATGGVFRFLIPLGIAIFIFVVVIFVRKRKTK